MKHICAVHRLQRSECLVDKVLAMIIGQILGTDDTMHVGLHQFLNQVDLCEALVVSWLLDVEDGDDVLMVEVAKELHLTESSQAEHGVIERSNLFDGDLVSGRLVKCRAV